METKIGNRVVEIQTSFWVTGPIIFELWVMKTELWVMETRNPNTPLKFDIVCVMSDVDKLMFIIYLI